MKLGLTTFGHTYVARLAARRATIPVAPPAVDYSAGLADGDPLGNDVCGNCAWAGVMRLAQIRARVAMGSTWKPTKDLAVAPYSVVTGYPATDNGTSMEELETYCWRVGLNLGIEHFRTAMPIEINPHSFEQIDAAIWAFGGVGAAWALPENAEQNLECWDYVPGAKILGGHFAPLCAYNQGSDMRYKAITWGVCPYVTTAFIEHYLMGVVGFLSPDWSDVDSRTPVGISFAELQQDAQQIVA